MSDTSQRPGNSTMDVLRAFAEPITDFINVYRSLPTTANGMKEAVANGTLNVYKCAKFTVSSVVLCTIVQVFLPSESMGTLTGVPVLDDVLIATLWIAFGYISAIVAYKPLKWMGGQASLRETVMVSLFGSAAMAPLAMLLQGFLVVGVGYLSKDLAAHVMSGNFQYSVYGLVGMILNAQIANLHNLKPGRVSWVIGLSECVALAMCLVLIIAVGFTAIYVTGLTVEDVVKNAVLADWRKNPEMREATIEAITLERKKHDSIKDALKFARDGGTWYTGKITATIRGSRETLAIEVRKDGSGISWELRPFFDPEPPIIRVPEKSTIPDESPPPDVDSLNGRGSRLYSEGKPKEAAAAFREAIRLDPNRLHAHINLGVVLQSQNDSEGAAFEYREVIRIDPDNADAHFNLGNIFFRQEKPKEAAAEYREVIRIDPKLSGGHFNLGAVLHGQGDLEEAIIEYREAIRLDPGRTEAHFNIGNILLRQDKPQQAITEYRETGRLDPDHADAHFVLGNLLGLERDMDGAYTELRSAIRIRPDNANFHYMLALFLHGQKKLEEAIGEYQIARNHAANDPELAAKIERNLSEAKGVK